MRGKAFTIRLNRDDFNFSAAQILIIGTEVEPLSGHNYHLGVTLTAKPSNGGFVIDFRIVKNAMRKQIKKFNHKTLIPTACPDVEVSSEAEVITVKARGLVFRLPAAHCLLLDVQNTSCECLAELILDSLYAELSPLAEEISYLAVELTESAGQSVVVSTGPSSQA